MIGKYDLADSYKSLNEALIHAGIHTGHKVKTTFIEAEETRKEWYRLPQKKWTLFLFRVVSEKRGTEGKILAIQYAREKQCSIPWHLFGHAAFRNRIRTSRMRTWRSLTQLSSNLIHRILSWLSLPNGKTEPARRKFGLKTAISAVL